MGIQFSFRFERGILCGWLLIGNRRAFVVYNIRVLISTAAAAVSLFILRIKIATAANQTKRSTCTIGGVKKKNRKAHKLFKPNKPLAVCKYEIPRLIIIIIIIIYVKQCARTDMLNIIIFSLYVCGTRTNKAHIVSMVMHENTTTIPQYT